MTNPMVVVAAHPVVAVAAAISILVVSVAVARFIDAADEISLTTNAGTVTARRTPRRLINGVCA